MRAKLKSLAVLWTELEKAGYAISVERCMGLVELMPRRLAAVIKNNVLDTQQSTKFIVKYIFFFVTFFKCKFFFLSFST